MSKVANVGHANRVDHVRVSQASRKAASGKAVNLVTSEPTIEQELLTAIDKAYIRLQVAERRLGEIKSLPYNATCRPAIKAEKDAALRALSDAKERLNEHREKYGVLPINSREIVGALIAHINALSQTVRKLGGTAPPFDPNAVKPNHVLGQAVSP